MSAEFVEAVSRELGGTTVNAGGATSSGAHEAVRVTQPAQREPSGLNGTQRRLYTLVWERSVAAVRPPITVVRHDISVAVGWKPSGSHFQTSVEGDPAGTLKRIREDLARGRGRLVLSPVDADKRVPRRFSEATLVAELDSQGIGRPSTFAGIIHRLVDKCHVTHTNNPAVREDCGLLEVALRGQDPRAKPLSATCSVRAGQRGVLRPTLAVVATAWGALGRPVRRAGGLPCASSEQGVVCVCVCHTAQ